MYAVIVGCGRVGSLLATTLSSRGHSIVILDTHEERFQRLGQEFTGDAMIGDGTAVEVLKESGIEKADALVMATNDDNSNLMGAQIARKMFGVKRVIVRIKDPKKFAVYKEYALEMVSATTLAADKIFELLSTNENIEIIGSMGDGKGKIVRFLLPSGRACKHLEKLIASGVFVPVSVSADESFELGIDQKRIKPGAVVAGGILTENLKHLNRCSTEEK